MRVHVDEAGHQRLIGRIDKAGLGVCRPTRTALSHRCDAVVFDEHVDVAPIVRPDTVPQTAHPYYEAPCWPRARVTPRQCNWNITRRTPIDTRQTQPPIG